jgi:hypothetical protein
MAGYNPEKYYDSVKIDGRSLVSLFNDPVNSQGRYVQTRRYWHYPFNVSVYSPFDGEFLTPHSAIMEGDYKLIFDWQGRLKLFNIKNDMKENHNLIHEMPEKTTKMYSTLMNWLEKNVDKQYWPVLNPDYDPAKEVRNDAPFVNFYKAWKEGEDFIK